MNSKMLGLLAIVMLGLSACAQSRMGLGGRFENVYLLEPVDLNGSYGSFVVQVNLTDNEAYLFAVDMTRAVAAQNLRVLAAPASGNFDILNASFRLDPTNPDNYVVIKPKSGLITDYSRWLIETTTTGNVDVGLTPEVASPGQGLRVVLADVMYPDLQSALQKMGGSLYTLAQ